ncbi:uncharacterized protein LOC134853904 isoform X2 [Symsagittifera roscoffensis]|uniref:uncharacterized protein LOC134853904 isoform X2 n=1 Tax=Symsagittifera roscoffensis TaxID=84072 RepID=UPI00307CB6F7
MTLSMRYLERKKEYPHKLPKLVCSTEGVKCVIVDSIAAVFRCETRSDISHVERSEIFFQLASSLKRLSVEHGVHVIVMNQVSDIFPEDVMNMHKWLTGTKKPSLGLSWSNCVTTRILVSCTQYLMPPLEVKGNHYTGGCGQGQSEGQVAVAAVPLRRLDVVMSPFCARRL